MLAALRRASASRNLFVKSQAIYQDTGDRVFGFGNKDRSEGELAGLLFVPGEEIRSLVLAFVGEEGFETHVAGLLSNGWENDDIEVDWDVFAIHVYALTKFAMDQLLPWSDQSTEYEGEFQAESHTINVSTRNPISGGKMVVRFPASFIDSLPEITPVERGKRIYNFTSEQIVNQL